MNRSIIALWEFENRNIADVAEKLLARSFSKVHIKFVKKDGSLRDMTIIPRREWNADIIHKETTEVGRKIVASKVAKGMATVVEVCPPDESHTEEWTRPRTINLAKIIELEEIK